MAEMKKPVDWITVKGNHVSIQKGQTKKEAVSKFLEDKKIEKQGLLDGAGSENDVVENKKKSTFINIHLFSNKGQKKLGINQKEKTLDRNSCDLHEEIVDKINNAKTRDDAQKILKKEIENGRINLRIKIGLQEKHIMGTNNYNQEIKEGRSPSVLTVDAQTLVNKHAGKGELLWQNNDKWAQKERFDDENEIGIYKSLKDNLSKSTRSGKIHYSKNGTHVVPTRERDDDD